KAAFFDQLSKGKKYFKYSLPSRKESGQYIQSLIDFMFPSSSDCECRFATGNAELNRAFNKLTERLECLLKPIAPLLPDSIERTISEFHRSLPEIYNMLLEDAQAITDNDPAAYCISREGSDEIR